MFIISSPTITGVYNNTPELFSFCQFYFDNPVPGLLFSSLISHSTHNCDRLVPASAPGLTAPFLIWHQAPARILATPSSPLLTPPHLP